MILSEAILYLCLNAFRIYIIYRFFGLFYEKSKQRKWLIWGYPLYYLLNSFCYLIFNYDKSLAEPCFTVIDWFAGVRGRNTKKTVVNFCMRGAKPPVGKFCMGNIFQRKRRLYEGVWIFLCHIDFMAYGNSS